MKRPSEKAESLAEEILDHVRYGLTRADAIRELAEMIDENCAELVESANALLRDAAEVNRSVPHPVYLSQLQRALADHQPSRTWPDTEPDLFAKVGGGSA